MDYIGIIVLDHVQLKQIVSGIVTESALTYLVAGPSRIKLMNLKVVNDRAAVCGSSWGKVRHSLPAFMGHFESFLRRCDPLLHHTRLVGGLSTASSLPLSYPRPLDLSGLRMDKGSKPIIDYSVWVNGGPR